MQVFIEGIGLRAGGLDGWASSQGVLCGEEPFIPAPIVLPPTNLLPANERRRLVTTVKLSLAVGTEAFAHAQREPAVTATVFTSSGGDGETIHNILETLAANEFEISPTRFHNSVHNAPSGYWSIATKSRAPSSSLCAHDFSFCAGLLDAAAQCVVDACAVGLIAYDLPYPEPLHTVRPVESVFGVAMVLTPEPTANSLAGLSIAVSRQGKPTTVAGDPGLERLRSGVPAARSLPLLSILARGTAGEIVLDYLGGHALVLDVTPAGASA